MFALFLHGQTRQTLSQDTDSTFYFHGSIGQTLEVEMILARHGKQIDGSYVYASQRKLISLKGEMTTPAQYQLEESTPQGAVTGHFQLNELDGLGHLSGTWESPDHKRKLPVILGQITAQQHQLLQKIWDTKPQIVFLTVGSYHSCVLRTLGASCWGEFLHAQPTNQRPRHDRAPRIAKSFDRRQHPRCSLGLAPSLCSSI